ncbi:hypothetical protein P9112_003519 [Eukaryota sp. TZLM1-RC]
MSITLGIDLGTTNTCVAVHRQKRSPNGGMVYSTDVLTDRSSGQKLIPSMVAFHKGQESVGVQAKEGRKKNAVNTVFEAKRFIGRRYSDRVVQTATETTRYPFKITKDGVFSNNVAFEVTHQNQKIKLRPEEVAAKVLSYVRDYASHALGVPSITKAVITVPAYFEDSQRQATMAAARAAGFQEVRLINEPTAAALALKEEDPTTIGKRVLVFDFGGGTFDVSIVKIEREDVTVLGTHGATDLGGADVDHVLMQFCEKNWAADSDTNDEPTGRKKEMLRTAIEQAKCALSGRSETEIEVENFAGDEDLRVLLTRNQLDSLCQTLYARTMSVVDELLRDLKLKASQIDVVQLVGGSSRILKVQELLNKKFPLKVRRTVNPDESVAAGASVLSLHLLNDVNPHSLGIRVVSKSPVSEVNTMSVLIPRNSRVPGRFSGTYHTIHDNQTRISVDVYQGEASIVSLNHLLDKFTITDLPKLPAGKASIEVSMIVDSDGILHVTATDRSSSSNTDTIKIEKIRNQFNISKGELAPSKHS